MYKSKNNMEVLGWPKSLVGFFRKMLQKNPNELFGQPNSCLVDKGIKFQGEVYFSLNILAYFFYFYHSLVLKKSK